MWGVTQVARGKAGCTHTAAGRQADRLAGGCPGRSGAASLQRRMPTLPGRLLTPCHTCAKRLCDAGAWQVAHTMPYVRQATRRCCNAPRAAPHCSPPQPPADAASGACGRRCAWAVWGGHGGRSGGGGGGSSSIGGGGGGSSSIGGGVGSPGRRCAPPLSPQGLWQRWNEAPCAMQQQQVHQQTRQRPPEDAWRARQRRASAPPPPPPGEVLPRTQCYHMYKGLRPCGSGSPPPPHTHTHLKMPVMCASAPPVRRASTYPPASSHRPCSGGSGGDELSRPVEATLRRSREARLGCTKTSESGCRRCRADKQLQQRCTCELAALCG